jgi:ppGpp synthetase/RelA/SpoT-type nucleotidyltranferase
LKAKKVEDDGQPKYQDPINEITDLAGVRVIVYTIDDINQVIDFIDRNFEVREKRDVGEERLRGGQIGYQSIHYLTKLHSSRLVLPEYSHFSEMTCEIQVRTVLQHAWAEMEHDIQYKSSDNIPTSIKRKFFSLAGLLEIADREFSSIQREDKQLKEGVLTELQKDLTRDVVMQPRREGVEVGTSAKYQTQLEPGVQVRSLLAARRYQDAIRVYDEKIRFEPSNYTLYLGRARARFLMGETNFALQDIDRAETYKPGDPAVKILRAKIAEGSLSLPQEGRAAEANDMMRRGHEALLSGRPEEAFSLYADAQSLGASWPFTTFNMAMASAVAGDITGSELLLGQLKVHHGTPMEINIIALRTILSALNESDDFEQSLENLKEIVSNKGDFSLEISPLGRLQQLEKSRIWGDKAQRVGEVLAVLSRGPQ